MKSPLVCFPPASGTADVYFRQILGLSALGYRVIAVRIGVLLGGQVASTYVYTALGDDCLGLRAHESDVKIAPGSNRYFSQFMNN